MPRSCSTIWSDVSSTCRIGLTTVVLVSELSRGSRVYVVWPPQIYSNHLWSLRWGFEYWLCSLPSLKVGLCSLPDLKIGSQLKLRLLGWYHRHLLQWCRWFFVTIGPPVHLHPWLNYRANCEVCRQILDQLHWEHCLAYARRSGLRQWLLVKDWYLGPEMRLMIRMLHELPALGHQSSPCPGLIISVPGPGLS